MFRTVVRVSVILFVLASSLAAYGLPVEAEASAIPAKESASKKSATSGGSGDAALSAHDTAEVPAAKKKNATGEDNDDASVPEVVPLQSDNARAAVHSDNDAGDKKQAGTKPKSDSSGEETENSTAISPNPPITTDESDTTLDPSTETDTTLAETTALTTEATTEPKPPISPPTTTVNMPSPISSTEPTTVSSTTAATTVTEPASETTLQTTEQTVTPSTEEPTPPKQPIINKLVDEGMPAGIVALIMAIVFVVVVICVYVGLIVWRRYLEHRYGNRELLVNDLEFDTNDLRHFENSYQRY